MSLRVIEGWRDLADDLRGAAVALGAFDGVHRGHRRVIAGAAAAARQLDVPLGVVTFEPHPRRLFAPDSEPFRLTNPDQQARVFADLGVERLYRLPFGPELAALSDLAFARDILAGALGVRHVSAGANVTFGRDRSGGPESLAAYGESFGFSVSITPLLGEGACSSTAIREALQTGRPDLAAEMLGRPFAIEGVVVHGDHLGRTIGFPTANMAMEDYVRPLAGIYAARTRLIDGREIAGAAYIGVRPTVNGVDERLEVNLFDFDEDLYGQTLETDLVAFIRGDQTFTGIEPMRAQIARDCAAARALLLPAL